MHMCGACCDASRAPTKLCCFMLSMYAWSRVVKTDVTKPGAPSSWPDVIPQHAADVLKGVSPVAGDKLLVRYLHDVVSWGIHV